MFFLFNVVKKKAANRKAAGPSKKGKEYPLITNEIQFCLNPTWIEIGFIYFLKGKTVWPKEYLKMIIMAN
jgi:hypothetical protein